MAAPHPEANIVRTWKNEKGDIIAWIEAGVLLSEGTEDRLPQYKMTESAFPVSYPFSAWVICDPDLEPIEGPRYRFSLDRKTIEELERYVRSVLPYRNVHAMTLIERRIAKRYAWRLQGAIKTRVRARLQARNRYYSENPGQRPASGLAYLLLMDDDLKNGFILDLIWSHHSWPHAADRIQWYLEDREKLANTKSPPDYQIKRLARDKAKAEAAVAHYRALKTPGVPPCLSKEADRWIPEGVDMDTLVL